ncbi:MAG: DegT/DnrJ/EryC1/StrS aminotransferase family protein [bacterium]|nr:DegT/DnrJ/EryC1/StrS aminotransferase family protein [bacterium]
MKKNIPFAKPYLDEQELNAIQRVLKSGWLTMGQETVLFEREFACYVDAKCAIAVNSCTSALFLALKAVGVGKGDEVVVPSFTFASTANVVVHCGATPVFVDINPNGFTIDPISVSHVINKKTKAIIPVHYGGNLAHTEFPVTVIEDSAHRITKGYKSRNIVCYSFYATKNLTTGEGGMITTEDKKLADWFGQARLHGLSRDAWKRYNPKGKWHYDVEFSGYKMNTIDILSAMGRVQLSKLDEMEKMRKKVVEIYNRLLGLRNHSMHLYPILVAERNQFMEYMKGNGISCSFHFLPLHKSPAFASSRQPTLPVTEYVSARVVTLPLFASLSVTDIEYIAQKVKEFGTFREGKFGIPVLS